MITPIPLLVTVFTGDRPGAALVSTAILGAVAFLARLLWLRAKHTVTRALGIVVLMLSLGLSVAGLLAETSNIETEDDGPTKVAE